MDATELLARQHRELLAVFDELEFTRDAIERTRLMGRVAERLKVHAALEEGVFYPALCEAAPDEVEDALAAHRALDVLLDETVGNPSAANAKILRWLVAQHFDDEEHRLFAAVEQLNEAGAAALASRLERYARVVDEEGPTSDA